MWESTSRTPYRFKVKKNTNGCTRTLLVLVNSYVFQRIVDVQPQAACAMHCSVGLERSVGRRRTTGRRNQLEVCCGHVQLERNQRVARLRIPRRKQRALVPPGMLFVVLTTTCATMSRVYREKRRFPSMSFMMLFFGHRTPGPSLLCFAKQPTATMGVRFSNLHAAAASLTRGIYRPHHVRERSKIKNWSSVVIVCDLRLDLT